MSRKIKSYTVLRSNSLIGVMLTGIALIGNYTIKNLINQFKGTRKPTNYTVMSIAKKLQKSIGLTPMTKGS